MSSFPRNAAVPVPRSLDRLNRATRPVCESLESRRLLAGELDTSFSSDGIQTVDFLFTDSANAAVVQPDGKTIIVGSADGGSADFAIARLNVDGTPDTTFSLDGRTTVSLGASEFATAVALLNDGRIIVAGYTSLGGAGGNTNNFAVIRLLADGTIDNSFNNGTGRAIIDFGYNDRPTAVAIQSDGKIVVGGFDDGGSADFAVARLTAGGVLDTTFNDVASPTTAFGDGKYSVNFGATDKAYGMAIRNDGKIVLAGATTSGSSAGNPNNFAVLMLNANGTPDLNFNGTGRRTYDFGSDDQATGVVVRPDGSIVAGGFTDSGSADFAAIALRSDGTLDPAFNPAGAVPGTISTSLGSVDKATGISLRADGKIVLTGSTTAGTGTTPNLGVLQLTRNGTIDTSFNNVGYNRIDLGGAENILAGAIAPDGRIIAAGNLAGNAIVARLVDPYAAGSGDGLFNKLGVKLTDFNIVGASDYATAVAVQKDGKIVVVGALDNISADAAIVRYNIDGTVDTTFSGDGVVQISLGGLEYATSVVIQPDGKIVVAGYTTATGAGANDFMVARLMPNGDPDLTFNNASSGVMTIDFGFDDHATALALQGDKIIVAGFSDGGLSDFAAVRLNSNGTIDTTFNDVASPTQSSGDGKISFSFGTGTIERATSVVVRPTGQIVLGGTTNFGPSPNNFGVAQLTPAGKLDSSFSGDGLFDFSFGGSEALGAMALLPTGEILVAGNNTSDMLVARVTTGGALDSSFNGGLALPVDFGLIDVATGIALQSDGKFIVSGFSSVSGTAMAAARFHSNGSPDNTFNDGSNKLTLKLGSVTQSRGMALDGDGRIILAGTTTFATQDIAVARFLPGQHRAIPQTATAPGAIEAENFDNGGEGIAYHDATNVNSGTAYRGSGVDINSFGQTIFVTDVRQREWLEYNFFAAETGFYNLHINLSSIGGGGEMRFELDGMPIPGNFGIPATGDSADFVDFIAIKSLGMFNGLHTLRVVFDDAPGSEFYDLNIDRFEWAEAGSISGKVINDVNGNGTQDAGELPMAGWNVYIDQNNNGDFDAGEPSSVTNAAGEYAFTAIEPGTYNIRESMQPGYRVANAPGGLITVTMNTASPIGNVNFFNTQRALIRGQVFSDFNANGTFDAGENKVANWTIYLDLNNNNVADGGEPAMLTNANGEYAFNQPAGTYFVKQVLQLTWRKTRPSGVPGYEVVAQSGEEILPRDFGNTHQALASGLVFHDLNGNGVKDGAETGLANVRVYNDSNNNAKYDVGELFLMTNGSGEYRSALPAGTYRGRIEWIHNHTQTSPPGGFYLQTLTQGQIVGNANFGLRPISPAPAITGASAAIATASSHRLGFFDDEVVS